MVTPSSAAAVPAATPSSWWSWPVLGRWLVVNVSAFVAILFGGVALELFAADTTEKLAGSSRVLAILLVALIGGTVQGLVLGRWQWNVLRRRMPGLRRRRWVVATTVPSLIVWLFVLAPGAVDIVVAGGDILEIFKNGFIQALVFGPLIGLSQATALRDDTTRWAWWLLANVTSWLFGAATYKLGEWLLDQIDLAREITPRSRFRPS